ncbi:MAG: type II toxin-antitoxin system VapC family toxin [Opitutales bacterium]
MYFDAAYLVRLYLCDRGFEDVRDLAKTASLACSLHGKAEVLAAFHRSWREGNLTEAAYRAVRSQFEGEDKAGAFHWLAVSEGVIDTLDTVLLSCPKRVFIRAADALHLASAKYNRFREIYSNDQRLLEAAKHFGLKGVDVIA